MKQIYVNETNPIFLRYALLDGEAVCLSHSLMVLNETRYHPIVVFYRHPAIEKLLCEAETIGELKLILEENYIEEFI